MKPFLEAVFENATARSRARYWLISDLQQGRPELAERYLNIAMDDFRSLNIKIDGVCYLGDAAEGVNLRDLKVMTDMQTALLDSLQVPIYYSIGNHELDYYRYARERGIKPYIPFYEWVKNKPNWHMIPDQESFWFYHETDDFVFLFFSDHASKDGSWCATHQRMPRENELPFYPHKKSAWIAVRDRFANCGKPVFTFSHCAFPGGNRPSEYLAQMLPLPLNFRAHFHGHSHIGDANWGGKDVYRQIACIDDAPVMQFDISSLDHLRGTTVRSAIFDYFGDDEFGVFFRDHIGHKWENSCIQTQDAKTAGIRNHFF